MLFEYDYMCVCVFFFSYFPVALQLCSVQLTVPQQVELHAALGLWARMLQTTNLSQRAKSGEEIDCSLRALVYRWPPAPRPQRPHFITAILLLFAAPRWSQTRIPNI